MSEKDCCPIMSLPEELLCYIFSYITDIPFKMKVVELVCKHFHFISSTKSSSWSGNDTLALNMNCQGLCLDSPPTRTKIKFFATSSLSANLGRCFHINGYKIAPEKWSGAITQLLERSIIRKLCLHIDDNHRYDKTNRDQICSSVPISVIKSNPTRFNLKYIEFHRRGLQQTWLFDDRECDADSLFFWMVEKSHDTLENIVLVLEEYDIPVSEAIFTSICAAVKTCPNLKSFTIKPPFHLPFVRITNALAGKPLTSLTVSCDISVFESEDTDREAIEESLQALCSASCVGIKSLSLKTWFKGTMTNLAVFITLDSGSRLALEEIIICNEAFGAKLNSYLSHLELVPSLYPNLRLLQLEFSDAETLDENLLLNTNFFDACNYFTPNVARKVFISGIRVNDINAFKEQLVVLCQLNEITGVFGDEGQSWVILTKGQGVIELGKVHGSAGGGN